MAVEDILLAGALIVITFNVMRRMERWLHQHIFKVGWLVTKNFQTTTILYYTFFLPGVLVNQLVYWLAAGALDVRADRAIQWPEKQEIGELRLNFIKLTSKKISPLKLAIIKITPFLAGMILVLLIAENVFDIRAVTETLQGGSANDIAAAIQQVIQTPDFWLWAYLIFTISNTMTPDFSLIRSYSRILFGVFIAVIVLIAFGVGQSAIETILGGPVARALNILSIIFTVIVVFDFAAILILAVIENSIEYMRGDTATFENGKMVVKTREQIKQERERERKKLQTRREQKRKAGLDSGPPSIYKIILPVPEAPGAEPVTGLTALVEPEDEQPQVEIEERDTPEVIIAATDRAIRFNVSRGDEESGESVGETIQDDDLDEIEDEIEDEDDGGVEVGEDEFEVDSAEDIDDEEDDEPEDDIDNLYDEEDEVDDESEDDIDEEDELDDEPEDDDVIYEDAEDIP